MIEERGRSARHDMPMMIDQIDRRILAALQRNGRLTNVELAEEVGLSPSPCLRRVRQLEKAGYIDKYVALLNPKKMGYAMTVFVWVWLESHDEDSVNKVIAAIQGMAQVVECHFMAGDCDFLLRVVAADLDDYRRFQSERLGRIEGVRSLKTEIPLQRVKQTWELPVGE